MITVGELFAGIGGFSLGLERAGGFKTKWFVEKDDYCNKVLEKHWPGVGKHKDVKTFTIDTSVNLLYKGLSDTEREAFDMVAKRKDYDEAVALYGRGLSIQDIADFYGITRQAMWMVLRRRGCDFRPQQKHGDLNHFHRDGATADKRAHHILEKAVIKGVIERRTDCEECGSSGKFKDGRSKIQAHHKDYNKPLEITWLCQKCHHEWHKKHKAKERKEVQSELIPTIDLVCGGFP